MNWASTSHELHKMIKNSVAGSNYEKKRTRNHQGSYGLETGKEKALRQTEEEVAKRSRR